MNYITFPQACRGEKLSVKTKYYEDVKVMVSERDNIDNRSRGDATDTAGIKSVQLRQ